MTRVLPPLLLGGALVRPSDAELEALHRLAADCEDWDGLVRQADAHGLAPLLARHLDGAHVQLPRSAARLLRALRVMHRDANAARLQALADILRLFASADVESVVLKGAALGILVYGDPALRPMCNLDLLVPRSDVRRAQLLLEHHGFEPSWTEPHRRKFGAHHHLPPLVRHVDGVAVEVELHHNAFHLDQPASLEIVRDNGAPVLVGADRAARHAVRTQDHLAFTVDGVDARTLGPTELLWHLSRGVVELRQPMQLVHAVDVVEVARQYEQVLDWDALPRCHPCVLSTLRLVNLVLPLPVDVARHLPGLRGSRRPEGIGQDYTGAPLRSSWTAENGGLSGLIKDTLFPPEWWLRMYYAEGLAPGWRWPLTLRHQLAVGGAGLRHAARQLRRHR